MSGVLHSALLRRLGWALSIIGLLGIAIGVPGVTWQNRHDSEVFNRNVGWANILAMSVGAIGVVFLILDRLGAEKKMSPARLAEIADLLGEQVLRRGGQQLARLLGTDELDSRAACMTFEHVHPSTRRNRKARLTEKQTVDLGDVSEYFLHHTRGRLVLTGHPGTGKTVTALRVLTDLALWRKTRQLPLGAGGVAPVPVMCNLAAWSDDEPLATWISRELAEQNGLRPQIASRLVDGGFVLPILDALDEVDGGSEPSNKATRLIRHVNEYVATTPAARVVITMRNDRQRYITLRNKLRGFEELTIRHLGPDSIADYIRTQCVGTSDDAWIPLLEKEIAQPASPMRSVLSVPWRLAMAVTYLKSGEDLLALLPTSSEVSRGARRTAYTSRVERLLYRMFVVTKSQHFGEPPAEVLYNLHRLALVLEPLRNGLAAVPPIVVLHNWWKVIDEKRVQRNQLFIAFALLHVPFGFYSAFQNVIQEETSARNSREAVLILLGFASNYILLYLLTFRAILARNIPSVIGARGLLTYRGVLVAVSTVIVAILVCGLEYLVNDPIGGLSAGAGVLLVGLLYLTFGSQDTATAQAPTAVLRKDLVASIFFGVAYGTIQVAMLVGFLGLPMSLCFGLAYLTGSVISSSAVKYLVAVYVGWNRFGLPLRFSRFLRWAARSGLLRISGVGYEFRHQGLRRYMASAEPEV